ncbi:hypothetical protein HCCG_00734 [Helicobacter cinaedi CCUG 18818 = ATCC BAA-847]|uniref:Uncharacterized protein n=1 Tax=Helicobacter cinaedi CCUG 18818 = ATCC BAA-847 TaxID=537971 RepID=A0ABN0BBR7_9HELI|nr:hypothetical protein HCCG_00734 [Helicobacter cinaedi CCUG 18818 = ATCC BAA-847]
MQDSAFAQSPNLYFRKINYSKNMQIFYFIKEYLAMIHAKCYILRFYVRCESAI